MQNYKISQTLAKSFKKKHFSQPIKTKFYISLDDFTSEKMERLAEVLNEFKVQV